MVVTAINELNLISTHKLSKKLGWHSHKYLSLNFGLYSQVLTQSPCSDW